MFSFESNGKAGEIGKGRKKLLFTFFDEIIVKAGIVGVYGKIDNGGVGFKSLNNNRGGFEVTTTNAADDLSEKFKSFFFGREIRERKAGVGLDDTDRGEMRKVETTRDGLGADNNFYFAGLDLVIESVQGFAFFVVGVEAGDFGFGKKFFEFALEEFGAEAFVEDARVMAVRAGSRDFFLVTASMTEELIAVGVESERQEAVGAEGLPAAFFAKSKGGGTAAVVIDEGLAAVFEVLFDSGDELVSEIVIFSEGFAGGKTDDFDLGFYGGSFGFFG